MQTSCRPTVLLIDDDPDILKLMEYSFADEGFDLVTCRSPEEGLRQVIDRRVDCVLLDIHYAHTPECFGFLNAMRTLSGQAEVPVIATSAMTGPEVVRRVLGLGARKFIPKPFYPGQVLQEIRSLVSS